MLTRHDNPVFSAWCVADVAVLCVIGVVKEAACVLESEEASVLVGVGMVVEVASL